MKALVVGAGVAGAAVALFLKRIGWQPEILEASPRSDRQAGAFLNLATNGLAVLTELGLSERLLCDAHPAPEMVMWSGSGKRLGTVPNGPAGRPDRGSVIVRRAWLHEVLEDAVTAAGVPVHRGARVSEVVGGGTRPQVLTDDGRVVDADVVIGADGIHSAVRRFVAPDGPRPVYSGLVGLGGFSRGLGLAPTPGQQHFVFGRRSFFGYLVRDDGTVYWFANATVPDRSGPSVPAGEWLERLATLHREDASPTPDIIAAADEQVGAYPIEDLVDVPRWHRGRAVLLGDAVHAISPSAGQGASLALEDAETLVRCLRDIAGTDAAFTTYEQLRRPRTTAIAEYARAINARKRAPGNAVAAKLRDLMLPMFLRRAADDTRLNWVYDWPSQWAEPVEPELSLAR